MSVAYQNYVKALLERTASYSDYKPSLEEEMVLTGYEINRALNKALLNTKDKIPVLTNPITNESPCLHSGICKYFESK